MPAASPMSHAGPQRGLTIIELMVVVAVIAVLVTLAAPSFRSLIAAQRVKGINAELVTDLQFARSEAATRGRPVRIRFNPAAACYVIYTDATSGQCDCNNTPVCTDEVSREEIKTVKLPIANGVSLSASGATGTIVGFDPRVGKASPPGFVVGVTSSLRGQLRTTLNEAGSASVCTPDGSISGVPACQ